MNTSGGHEGSRARGTGAPGDRRASYPVHSMIKRSIQYGITVAVGAALAGCVTPENDRITLGRAVQIGAFVPTTAPAGADMAAPVGTAMVQEPSVIGLDRSNWEPTRFHQPVDGTAHRLQYSKRLHVARRTARQRGEYPSAESALELSGGSTWQQQAEAAGSHAIAAADLLLLLPRMVWTPPWRVRWSPDVGYERTWAPERPLFSEDLEAPLDDPFAAPPPHPVTPVEPRDDER
jgi:hypothetical protein